jgi:hypothetical protein
MKYLKAKDNMKIYYWDNWPQNKYLPGQKTKKIILPGLGP